MKIIEKGYLNNVITCVDCRCKYEYDYHDIMTTIEYTDSILGHYEINYIRCPMCGKKKALSKEFIATKINSNIGIMAPEVEK